MSRRLPRIIAGLSLVVGSTAVGACATTGSHQLTCTSTEIAPNTQPGATTPRKALDWYLHNGDHEFGDSDFSVSGKSETRYVFRSGDDQISVGALPVGKGESRTWVVLMTYRCT